MAAVYPGALPELPEPSSSTAMDASGYEHDLVHVELAQELTAVATELGTDPAGAQSTVGARILLGLLPLTASCAVWASGSYVSNNPVVGTSNATQTLPFGDRTFYLPFFVPMSVTVDRVGVYVATSQTAANCRIGRYAFSASGEPTGNVLDDWGEIDASTTGYKELTVSTSLSEGWHCMAILNEVSNVGFRCSWLARSALQPGSGAASTVGWQQSSTTYTSGFATVSSADAWSGVLQPLIYLRRA